MLTNILAALLLAVFLVIIALLIVCSVDVALRERYEAHAERKYREKYRRWCAQTPVKVDSRLVVVCGKGYEDDAA